MECIKVNSGDRQKILAELVGLVPEQSGQKLIIAELIRAAFFSLRRDSINDRVIYIRSILDYVRTRLKLINNNISEEDDLFRSSGVQNLNEIIIQVMDDLDLVSDITEASAGYWAELPDRFILLNDDIVVLLSPMPTSILKDHLGIPLGVQSLARTCSKSHIPKLKKYGFIEQSIRSWIADFNWEPDKFLVEMVSTANTDLKQIEIQDEFKVYSPAINGDRKQAFRWLDSNRLGKNDLQGLFLCKRTGRYSIPVYWLGQLVHEDGEVLAINEFRLHSNSCLKIQFALDYKFEAKNTVYETEDGNFIHFEFEFRLPFELHRLFSVLAVADTYPDRWVRRLTFNENSADFVRTHLKNMKVNLIKR